MEPGLYQEIEGCKTFSNFKTKDCYTPKNWITYVIKVFK